MSAPQTDPERQRQHHRWPLLGMAAVVLFAVLVIVYWLFDEAYRADNPDPDPDVPAGQAAPPDPGGQPPLTGAPQPAEPQPASPQVDPTDDGARAPDPVPAPPADGTGTPGTLIPETTPPAAPGSAAPPAGN